jgi:hypothetical protein
MTFFVDSTKKKVWHEVRSANTDAGKDLSAAGSDHAKRVDSHGSSQCDERRRGRRE